MAIRYEVRYDKVNTTRPNVTHHQINFTLDLEGANHEVNNLANANQIARTNGQQPMYRRISLWTVTEELQGTIID